MTIPSNAKTIWDYLKSTTEYSDIGIAALMGNLYAESALEPNRKQGDFTADRIKSTSYTSDVDGGVIPLSRFRSDAIGYGLAQWTYFTRKQNLLQYAWKQGKSVGDLCMQLDFLVIEMETDFKTVAQKLRTGTDLQEVSNAVLFHFENPADQSVNVQNIRASYGKTFYNEFAGKSDGITISATTADEPTAEEIRKVLNWLLKEYA